MYQLAVLCNKSAQNLESSRTVNQHLLLQVGGLGSMQWWGWEALGWAPSQWPPSQVWKLADAQLEQWW